MTHKRRTLRERWDLKLTIIKFDILETYIQLKNSWRIRKTLVVLRVLTLVARSRFWTALKEMDEFHPILSSDPFGTRTLSASNKERHESWLLELRQFFHLIDFPEEWKDGRPEYKRANQFKEGLSSFSPTEALA
jgi:hypothetical protein